MTLSQYKRRLEEWLTRQTIRFLARDARVACRTEQCPSLFAAHAARDGFATVTTDIITDDELHSLMPYVLRWIDSADKLYADLSRNDDQRDIQRGP